VTGVIPPTVSVIVPSHNRAWSLRQALRSLADLEFPKDAYEIVVVDDGSSDGTEAAVADLRPTLPATVRYVRRAACGGAAAARNAGIQIAAGAALVFTDDDCVVQADWLRRLLAAFDTDEVGVVGGPDRAPPDAPFFGKCVDYLLTSFVGSGGLRRGDGLRVGRYYPRGCNMAVRREVIAQIGLFDESLGPGEEIELAHRAVRAGYRIRFAPQALVWHARSRDLRSLLRKIFDIGYARVVLARKHRGLLQLGHMIPFLGIVAAVAGAAMSFMVVGDLAWLAFLIGLYGLSLAIASVQALGWMKDVRALLVMPILIPLHHAAHGLGFLTGVVHWLLGRRPEVVRRRPGAQG